MIHNSTTDLGKWLSQASDKDFSRAVNPILKKAKDPAWAKQNRLTVALTFMAVNLRSKALKQAKARGQGK